MTSKSSPNACLQSAAPSLFMEVGAPEARKGLLMADTYEWGKAARMTCYRLYLGLRPDEMATALGIALRSYQRYENGQAAIPEAMWERVLKLTGVFDRAVEALLGAAEGQDRYRVLVGKEGSEELPASMWMRVVSEAMLENPSIDPYFIEDENPPKDDPAVWRG